MPSIVACRVYRAFRKSGEARGAALLAAALLGLSAGGCSMSFPMASLVPDDGPATTASIAAKPVSPLSPKLGAEDWRRAKGALAVALDPHGSGAKVSWDNPDTGLRGAFTPLGQAFVKNDEICRSFVASLVGRDLDASLQGTACRLSGGEWAVQDMKARKQPG